MLGYQEKNKDNFSDVVVSIKNDAQADKNELFTARERDYALAFKDNSGNIKTINELIDGPISVDTVNEATAAAGVTVDGLLIKDGGIAPTGTTATAGVTYSGTISATGAGTPQTLNTLVGTVEFTGVADIAAADAGTVVINNSLVTASTVGMVSLQTTTAAAGSTPRVESVTYGVGTITIVLRNSAAATATGAATYKFSFQLFKL